MKEFSTLGVEINRRFIGSKISIRKLEDEKVIIKDYEFRKSKLEPRPDEQLRDGDWERVLYVQIEYKGELRVFWGNYKFLFKQFEQITNEMLPFSATIANENGWIMK